MALVFQYGSNTSSARLNGSGRLRGDARDVGLVRTRDPYELVFDVWSEQNECAAADIRPDSGRPIWGVLYEIPNYLVAGSAHGRRTLRQIEGPLYAQTTIAVQKPDGTLIDGDVITFTVREPRNGLRTSLEYATHILRGLREHEAPEDYLAYVTKHVIHNNAELALPMNLSIYCGDVGSVAAGNFAWCASSVTTGLTRGASMPDLAGRIARDLNADMPVALGFECPLFVPISHEPERLTCARRGEGSRAWSAGAGCGALSTGLPQVVWILRQVRRDLSKDAAAFVEWTAFTSAASGLFLWEAFVSGKAKRDGHAADAEAAVEAFAVAARGRDLRSTITSGEETYSLLGAALLRAGWSNDLSLLSRPCAVISA